MSTDTGKGNQAVTQKDMENLYNKFDVHYDERMDRIERKLNQLTDAVVSIARAEEKITVLIQDTREIKETLNSNMRRIQNLEIDNEKTKASFKTMTTFFWTAVSAITTVIAGIIISNYGL